MCLGKFIRTLGVEENVEQTPVVGKVDSAIHWINHYTVDNTIGFRSTFPLDSAIQLLNNRG